MPMNSLTRFLTNALMILLTTFLFACKVSGEVKVKTPIGKVKVEVEHKTPKHKCKKCGKHDCKHLKKKKDKDDDDDD